MGVNINAVVLNGMFKKFLEQFEYNRQHYKSLKALMTKELKEMLQDELDDIVRLKKPKSELLTELDKMGALYQRRD